MPSGWLGLDWGNVPSWVGSVLTSFSVGFASITYYRSTNDRRQARDDAERTQAARVSLWWENPRKALVRNSNDVAVTVQVFVEDRDSRSDPLNLSPGETRALQLPVDLADESAAVGLVIVDSYGRSWIRPPYRPLERVTAEHSPPRPSSRERLRWEAR
jgi:hypothetical protein